MLTEPEQDELRRLCDALVDETITPIDHKKLEQWLVESQEASAFYVDYVDVSAMLILQGDQRSPTEVAAAPSVFATDAGQGAPVPSLKISWFSWRPLTAAAVGIIAGMLTTTIAWAYTGLKTPEVQRIEIPLMDPGFEEVTTPVPAVIPRALNRWNGDPSHAVSSGDSGVKPKQGRFMMKMQPVEDRRFSRIEQIVDVSHLVPAKGGAVEYSASIICDGAVNQSKMILVLRAFTIGNDEISGSTEKLDDQVTSEARKTVFIPPGSTDWKTGNLRMDLPENTKTLVFAIAAVDLPKASKGTARYIDDIKATIVTTQPAEVQQ